MYVYGEYLWVDNQLYVKTREFKDEERKMEQKNDYKRERQGAVIRVAAAADQQRQKR